MKIIVLAACLLMMSPARLLLGSLLTNGSFESYSVPEPIPPEGFLIISGSPTEPDLSITGWSIDAGTDVQIVSTAWQASEGLHSLGLNGRQGGTIYQTIESIPDAFYDVTFDLAANPYNAAIPASFRLSAADTSHVFSFDRTGHTPANMGWQSQSWSFQATDSTTTLKFETLQSGSGGNAIDNVVVMPAPDSNILFFDDFESESEPIDERGYTENYAAFEKWNVQGSGVDLLDRSFFPDQGIVVDLDGTTGSTLTTKEALELMPGTYQLTFDLGGPLGGDPANSVVVSLGSVLNESIDIPRGSPFETFDRQIVVSTAIQDRLSFTDLGADSNGALLDNVQLKFLAPPELLWGDINDDGLLTVEDLDELSAAILNNLTDAVFDINGDGSVNHVDRTDWVTDVRGTVFGDANLDGQFDSTDLIQVLQIGEYADAIPGNSTWSDGDFGGDQEFDTDDLVLALQTDAYETGPVAAHAVPEPTSAVLVVGGGLALLFRTRQRLSPKNSPHRR